MLSNLADDWVRWIGGSPCFWIHGKSRRERPWRRIAVYATARRNRDSAWPFPFLRGTCITWTHAAISLGWDVSSAHPREQSNAPAAPFPVRIAQVRNEHMPWLVRDQQRRPRLHRHRLRGYAARPENRQFAGMHFDRVAEIRMIQVADADGCRIAEMDRRPVCAWKA